MNTNKKDSIYYLEYAPVPRVIFHMAIPMIMNMILDSVYNIVSAIFVGEQGNGWNLSRQPARQQ